MEEIALLYCCFVKGDGRKVYYPNPKLIGEPIVNISRWDLGGWGKEGLRRAAAL